MFQSHIKQQHKIFNNCTVNNHIIIQVLLQNTLNFREYLMLFID